MRYFTFLVVCGLLLGFSAQAQDGRRTVALRLQWEGYHQVPGSDYTLRKVPAFMLAHYQTRSLFGSYVLRVAGTVAEGELRNATYAPFSAADAALLKNPSLPLATTIVANEAVERGQPISFVTVPAVRRNAQSGQFEKLISAEYSYIPGAPTVRRGQQITYASNSVLATGNWYKIGVPKSGIFKLDYDALRLLGLDVQSVDPNRIQIFGNATGLLPQPISTSRPDDLVENAVYFSGNTNTNLENGEYFLFYARGPHVWERVPGAQRFQHIQNIYSDTAYYFVTVAAPPRTGRRVQAAPAIGAANAPAISQFTEREFYEKELVNLAKSGRQWLGEGFRSGTPQSFSFGSITDVVAGSTVQVTASLAGNSYSAQSFQVAVNGASVGTQILAGASNRGFPEYANTSVQTYSVAAASSSTGLRVSLTYNGSDASDNGYLDYLEVNALKPLRLNGSAQEFRSFSNVRPGSISQFNITGGAGAMVWEVTNPRRARSYPVSATGSFVAPTDSLREFVAFTPTGTFDKPTNLGRVANQDLHASLNSTIDLVIVTHPLFLPQAEALATHRRTHDGLKVAVVTTTQVYNEFGSGGQDVSAIRDMMKMVYDRRNLPSRRQYLLLFGDASFNYKGGIATQNFVPTYESRESFAPIYGRANGFGPQTFCSDDYYGLLDDTDGEWREDGPGETMDVSVGRLPVRIPSGQAASTQATLVVNKLIAYDTKSAMGNWRNRFTVVTDDGDNDLHVVAGENLARWVSNSHPVYNVNKNYLDLYQQITGASGEKSPDAERAVDESFEQGSLIINYNGHGGPDGLAQEQLVSHASVLRLQNKNRPTFMVTGTCDFSYYDNPDKDSAGEQALTDVEGGAIGLYTTTRLTFADGNALTIPFYDSILSVSNAPRTRVGEAIRYSKNQNTGYSINRNYVLLGDPSAHLAQPDLAMSLDAVNDKPIITASIDTLKALSTVKLSGSVHNNRLGNGAVDATFSGTTQVVVYDKPTIIKTLGSTPGDSIKSIRIQENVIYSGQATVRAGRFSVQFVVPRDINYSVGLGKVSLYAKDTVRTIDAHGYRSVPIGSTIAVANLDTIPPKITLHMDNMAFVYGGLTAPTTTLLARLFDESGINTAGSGIGHEITATLDNDPARLTVLNDFYTANVDSFQSGNVRYLFKDLATGPHVLHVKAWDTFNNSSIKDIEFIAAQTEKLALSHVLNYPNPFAKQTTFHFDHNRSGEELDVQVQIFTVAGRLVRTLQANIPASGSHVPASPNDTSLSWNGRDEYNDQLARGVYVYRVSVRSSKDQATTSKFEKLVILN
ncbi:type IX secretion system sortase PorU [Hymenobacter sp. BT186]|uniref:Type IX secretion system sortase PorU n=1 Tax=Hymenobacter telluris TaxID=2816474 RepID=A0A939EVH8_9BACT|nr:type IX secretion system sortase PorU [Hymenobacter telluris]MBO0357771.1 type IX secretion system sortase PorU [Hymenobacter telluris]MBW3373798.1 type IX secretion system sortase PorU [Hymenobacter norwichensis]